MIWNKIYETSFADNETFKFYLRRNPTDKVATIEEQLDDVEVDGTGNLVDLPR